jgi:hypothetical protein
MHQPGRTTLAKRKYGAIVVGGTFGARNPHASAGSTAIDTNQVFNHVVASIAFICHGHCSF